MKRGFRLDFAFVGAALLLATTSLLTTASLAHAQEDRGEGYGAGDAGVFIRAVLAAAPHVPVMIAHMAGWGPSDEATDSAMQDFVDAFEDGTLDPDRFTLGVGVVVDDPNGMEGDRAGARRAAERNGRLAARMRDIGLHRVVFSTDGPFFPPQGDPRTRIARNRTQLRDALPLEPDEFHRFSSNVGPAFRRQVEEAAVIPDDTVREANRPVGLTTTGQISVADTIRRLAVESMRLWNDLDPDAWLALFADSVRWYYYARSLDRAGVENMVHGLMSVIRDSRYRVVSDPDVVILGPDAAVASFSMIQSATGPDDIELEELTGLTFVYQRIADDWKIVRVHESIEPPPDSVIAGTIMARTRELAVSWERLDADAYLAWFSEDLTFYFQGARVSRMEFETTVRDAIASLRESTFEVVNPDVEVLGANAAAISFEIREVMLDRTGAITEVNGALTLVWERREGRWLIVRAHESLR